MVINVSSGLASRMRTIAQAYYLCKKWDEDLVIYWPLEDCCAIGYFDVFEKNQFSDINVTIKEYDICRKMTLQQMGIRKNLKGMKFRKVFKELVERCRIKNKKKWLEKIARKYNYIDYYPSTWEGDEHRKKEEKGWNELLMNQKNHKECFLNVYCGIIWDRKEESSVPYSSVIKIKERYIKKAKEIINHRDCIGLHIRRTDHTVAMSVSSVESFINKINIILEKWENQMFYLSTDDLEVERKVIDKFGNHIIVQDHKAWGRENVSGMESAIIDMLCLSMCKKIYGSYTSVFSLFSAKYGGIDLEICGESKSS